MNLDNVIGVNVKVTNVINESSVGRIYSWNTDSNTLTLLTNSPKSNGKQQQQQQEPFFSFKLFKISFIQKIEVIPNQSQPSSQAYLKKEPLKPHHVYPERIENFINGEIKKYREQNSMATA
ncbi:hypothetical protein ACO0RG_001098 [Hanseniaspora osmophila]|uniref:LSM12 anticodon-binding domain-containing protein n=1 Tax=Hanseniaspora osmophila TaxID=56408 RepID=A0A1E5RPN6_9ASCO|nr:hypothetical protein AWRI3579_g734 [Hanseniaspora osmophila]